MYIISWLALRFYTHAYCASPQLIAALFQHVSLRLEVVVESDLEKIVCLQNFKELLPRVTPLQYICVENTIRLFITFFIRLTESHALFTEKLWEQTDASFMIYRGYCNHFLCHRSTLCSFSIIIPPRPSDGWICNFPQWYRCDWRS